MNHKLDPSIPVMLSKIHRAKVTDAELDYEGSITIDPVLLEASGIAEHQMVHVNNLANGVHWETYVLAGPRGKGRICLNGPPAHHFKPGDTIVIVAYGDIRQSELPFLKSAVVFVDKKNRITKTKPV
jgi:aspartate 1-decarboxylase